MSAPMPSLVRLDRTPEELQALEAEERRRQREVRVELMRVDRSLFDHDLLDQVTRQIASDFVDEERAIARKRGRVRETQLEALKKLTAPAGFWRRVVWGER